MYIPKSKIERFPNKEDSHIIHSVHKYDYDYNKLNIRPKSFFFRLKRFFLYVVILIIVTPMTYIRFGLVIKNKKVYKKHKKEIKDGYITISNHVFPWDFLCLLATRYGRFPEFPMWQEGFEGKGGKLYQAVGGFPVVNTITGYKKTLDAMKDVLFERKWLHIYPEAACWQYYVPLREFKEGCFRLAYETAKPIIPIGISYRKAHGFFLLYKRNKPLITLTIGEPMYADKTLSMKEARKKLKDECFLKMLELCGISSIEENNELKKKYEYME